MPAPNGNQHAKGNRGSKGSPKYKPEYAAQAASKKGKRGRPSKYSSTVIPVVRGLVALGKTDAEIAEVLGIGETTFYDWKKAHPEFSVALEHSKELINAQIEATMIQRALGYEREVEKVSHGRKVKIKEYYPPDVGAGKFLMQTRMPEQYREVREERKVHDVDKEWLRWLEKMDERDLLEREQRKLIPVIAATNAEVV